MTDSRKGRHLGMGREISRRDFVNGFAVGTAGLAGMARGGGATGGGRAGEQSMSQTFIRNGTIISMDPEIGDLLDEFRIIGVRIDVFVVVELGVDPQVRSTLDRRREPVGAA